MDEARAVAVLDRFGHVIKTVARNLAETFPSVVDIEDAEQDASLVILSYAGLIPSQYGLGHVGSLTEVETSTRSDESRMTGIISTQLRLDLSRHYGREADKREATMSLDTIDDNYLPPSFDITDALKNESNFRKHYPTLTLWLIDDMTQEEIAEMANVGIRTVERRIAKEKRTYLERYCRRGGLRVEGNETLDELQEACGHLREAGR